METHRRSAGCAARTRQTYTGSAGRRHHAGSIPHHGNERRGMSTANITAFCAFIMTVLAFYLLGFYTFIPPCAVFIAWACFFHMGGGTDRKQALVATISHMSLGAFSAWLSALALLHNPF